MVGALVKTGVIGDLARLATAATGGDALVAVLLILLVSAVLSGIIDNIPYVATMSPLVAQVAAGVDNPVHAQALWWSLALGADFGGNLTAVGASANVVMHQKRVAENLAAVEAHFHSEAANEVATALKLYTEDIVWEAPALNGLNRSYSGKEAVAENYRQLWASMRDVKFTFLQRFATEDRVVDDSLVTFEVIRDGWHFPVGSQIEMRLVHIFEMLDGKISRELVFDMGRPRR